MLSKRTLLYTEMVTANALVYGDTERLLRHAPAEFPLALQLGGSDPVLLAQAVAIATDAGFCEVNLNVGCPSDRVQGGAFGACLMRSPDLVADCLQAMLEAASGGTQITAKCRIGVDDQDPECALRNLVDQASARGVRRFAIHARKAWLDGLSPKENRIVPPLDYELVRTVRAERPDLEIVINGGISSLDDAMQHLEHVDGVMIGRAAYHDPAGILASADRRIFDEGVGDTNPIGAVRRMYDYIETELSAGTRLSQITRHMLGAFAGRPGARRWRRTLSEGAFRSGSGIALIEEALTAVGPAQVAE